MCASKPYWEDNGVFVKDEYNRVRTAVLKIDKLKPKHFPISWTVEGKNELMNMKRSDVVKTLAMIFSKVRHFDFVEYYSELNVKRQTMKDLIVKCGGYHRLLGDVRRFIVMNSIRILDTCFYNEDMDTSKNVLEDLQLALLVLPYVSELITPYLVSLVRAKGIKNTTALGENTIPFVLSSYEQLNMKNKSIYTSDLEKCGILQFISSIFILAYKHAYVHFGDISYSVIDCRCGRAHEPYINKKAIANIYRTGVLRLISNDYDKVVSLAPDTKLALVPLDVADAAICSYDYKIMNPRRPQPTLQVTPIADKYLSITGPDEFKSIMPISVSKRKAYKDNKQSQITKKEQNVLTPLETNTASSKVEEGRQDQSRTSCTALEEAENKIIHRSKDLFAAGEALRDIRRHKLYKPKYRSFASYYNTRLNLVPSHVYRMIKGFEIRDKLLTVDNIREKKQSLPKTVTFFYTLKDLTFEDQQRIVLNILEKGGGEVTEDELLAMINSYKSGNINSTKQACKKTFDEDELKREIALLIAKDNDSDVINIQ